IQVVDCRGPDDPVNGGKADLRKIEFQLEFQRPWPALADVPDYDTDHTGTAHGDQAADEDGREFFLRQRHRKRNPDCKEWQPRCQNHGAATDRVQNHFGELSQHLRFAVSPLTAAPCLFTEIQWQPLTAYPYVECRIG